MSCPLCSKEHLTEWLHEDDTCWCCYCVSHPDKVIIVLKRHDQIPTEEELEHMYGIAKKLFPKKSWRGPNSILDHFHLHEE